MRSLHRPLQRAHVLSPHFAGFWEDRAASGGGRHDPAVRQFGRFLVVGVSNTLISFVVYRLLLALRMPILFVQGTRDALCPLDKLAAVRARMTARSTLLAVEGGDHSLAVSAAQRKASGSTQTDSDARVLDAIKAFVS